MVFLTFLKERAHATLDLERSTKRTELISPGFLIL